MSTNGSRFSGQCEDSPNKHSKSQHKPVDSKDLYGRSMHPEAADLWDGSAVWRWMPLCGIWDRWGWECSQSQQGCQGAQRHVRALWSGHWSITEAINNSSWKNIIWEKKIKRAMSDILDPSRAHWASAAVWTGSRSPPKPSHWGHSAASVVHQLTVSFKLCSSSSLWLFGHLSTAVLPKRKSPFSQNGQR